jgi:RHS repeat-associated protein
MRTPSTGDKHNMSSKHFCGAAIGVVVLICLPAIADDAPVNLSPVTVTGSRISGFKLPEPGRSNGLGYFGAFRGVALRGEGGSRFSPVQPDNNNEGSGGCENDGAGKSAGNPVIISTGNKVETQVDLVMTDNEPLELVRHYNRQPADHGGSFGFYWRGSFDHRLAFSLGGPASEVCGYMQEPGPLCSEDRNPATYPYVHYFAPDGARITYTKSGSVWADSKGSPFGRIAKVSGGWELRTEDFSILRFDDKGNIQSMVDRHGIGLTWTYFAGLPNRASTITSTTGRAITLTWQNNRVATIKDPANQTYTYSYDASGRLTGVTYPSGAGSRTYHYEIGGKPDLLTGVSVNGARYSTFEYYSDDRAKSTRHGSTDLTQFSYGTSGTDTWTDVTGPGGAVSRHTYRLVNGKNKLVSVSRSGVTNCPNSAQSMAYDTYGYLDYSFDFQGVKTDTNYNAAGQLQNRRTGISPNGLIQSAERYEEFGWTADNQVDWVKTYGATLSEPISTVDYAYYTSGAAVGRLQSVTVTDHTALTSNLPRTTTYSYSFSANGIPSQIMVDGPLSGTGDRLTYNYNSKGDLLSVANSLWTIASYAGHNAIGRPASMINANGHTISFQYYPRGQLKQTSATVNGQTATRVYTIDGLDNVTSETLNGTQIAYRIYGSNGLLGAERENSSSQEMRAYTYDSQGLVTRYETSQVEMIPDPNCPPIGPGEPGFCPKIESLVFTPRGSWDYDEIGRLTAEMGNNGQNFRYKYDGNGNVIETTDSLNRVTRHTYDSQNQRIKTESPAVGGQVLVTDYDYDGAGRLKWVADPRDKVTEYLYNGFGELREQRSPDTGTTKFTYDSAGRRDTMTRNDNQLTQYTYDSLGRLKTLSAGGQSQSFTYDTCTNGKGQLCSVTDPGGTVSYTYTKTGQPASQTSVINGTNFVTSWTYDVRDRLIQISYPGGNKAIYEYDNRDQVTAVKAVVGGVTQNLATGIKYMPYGPILTWAFGNTANRARTYDDDYRLKTLTTAGIQGLSYTHNANNSITKITHTLDSTLTQTLTYDEIARLKTANATSGNQSWTFDGNGNRLTHLWGGATDTYVPQTASNRITSITGTRAKSFTYDTGGLGNLLGKTGYGGSQSYTYDPFNRLKTATVGSATTTYLYNGLHQRARKTGSGGNYSYVHTPDGTLLGETSSNGTTLTTQYLWLHGEPIGLIRNNVLYYVHADHLGRPEVITNQSKAVVWKAKNFAYDRTIATDTLGGLNLGLPGQYFDQESGLWYNWNRYYDPSTGRYLQSDQLGLAGGLNTYSYALANPLTYVDLDGQLAFALPLIPPVLTALGQATAYVGSAALAAWGINTMLNKDGSESKPDNCPSGTLPIDQAKGKFGLDKDKVHGIKDGVQAGPRTWTGIAPNGDVWTGGPGGIGTNHGPYGPYLPGGK